MATAPKDTAKNNFPKLPALRESSVIPAWKMFIEHDSHIFYEIRGTFFPGLVKAGQNRHGDFQAGRCLGLFHQLFGDVDGMKDHALAGTGDVWKQAMFDRIVF